MHDNPTDTAATRRFEFSKLDAYLLTIDLAAAAVIVGLFASDRRILPAGHVVSFVAFALLLLLGELRPLKWLRLGDGGEVTMTWAFSMALLFVGPLSGAVVTVGIASLIGDLVQRKALRRTIFNAGQLVIALACAGAVLELTGLRLVLIDGRSVSLYWIVAVSIAAIGAFLVNGTLTCIAIALSEGTGVRAMLRRGVMPNISTDGALLALAPCFVVVAERSIVLLPLVLVTASFVYRSSQDALLSEHAATGDPLTELLNRRAFDDQLGRRRFADDALRPHVGVALIDLNGFKAINDRLGHHVGDHVLREVARRLNELRSAGSSRQLGGDEFARCSSPSSPAPRTPNAGPGSCTEVISRDSTVNGYPLAIGGSVGIATVTSSRAVANDLLRDADSAMYRAKRQARRRHPRSVPRRPGTGRTRLLGDLARAITEDQFVMHCASLGSPSPPARVVAFEALIRWHPTLGLVMPGSSCRRRSRPN
ncbi:MAG: diguanylate cyclase [Ilumatobacteraceae bacterium]